MCVHVVCARHFLHPPERTEHACRLPIRDSVACRYLLCVSYLIAVCESIARRSLHGLAVILQIGPRLPTYMRAYAVENNHFGFSRCHSRKSWQCTTTRLLKAVYIVCFPLLSSVCMQFCAFSHQHLNFYVCVCVCACAFFAFCSKMAYFPL